MPLVVLFKPYSNDWIVRPGAFVCEREDVGKTRSFHDGFEGEWS